MKYQHLFEPIKVGNKVIKNRIFMPPISTNLANKGYVTDELVKHYGDRAKGGVGLIVSEVVTVEPVYVYLPGDMSIHDDSYIDGWRRLYEEVHKYGVVLLPQLFHRKAAKLDALYIHDLLFAIIQFFCHCLCIFVL